MDGELDGGLYLHNAGMYVYLAIQFSKLFI